MKKPNSKPTNILRLPVVIDIGVSAIEVDLEVYDKIADAMREVPVQFGRVALDSSTVNLLPFVVTNVHQHIFSLYHDLKKSTVLLVYDSFGRLFCGYFYVSDSYWEKFVVSDEVVGRTIVQDSVRYAFPTRELSQEFVHSLSEVKEYYRKRKTVPAPVKRLLAALHTCRTAPVVYPISSLSRKTVSSSSEE